jgi:hypothetical protein
MAFSGDYLLMPGKQNKKPLSKREDGLVTPNTMNYHKHLVVNILITDFDPIQQDCGLTVFWNTNSSTLNTGMPDRSPGLKCKNRVSLIT